MRAQSYFANALAIQMSILLFDNNPNGHPIIAGLISMLGDEEL